MPKLDFIAHLERKLQFRRENIAAIIIQRGFRAYFKRITFIRNKVCENNLQKDLL